MSQVVAKSVHPVSQLQPLPFDRALPGSLLLHHPADLTELVSSSLGSWLGNGTYIEDMIIHVRGHKPGRRCIFELELLVCAEGRTQNRQIVGKLYAHNQGAKAYENLLELWSQGFATGPFNIPQPLYYDKDWQLLLMNRVTGDSLQQLILTERDVSKSVVRAAEWLVELHKCGVTKGRRHEFNRYIKKPSFWRRYLKVVYPEAEPLFAEILSRIENRSHLISRGSNGPSHHDYSADHLIIGDDQITAVDFDEFCQYDPLFDVAHFIVQLRNLGLTRFGSLRRFDRLAELFETTYASYAEEYSIERLRLYMAVVYLKLVHINAFNQRAQDWKDLVNILLQEAQHSV